MPIPDPPLPVPSSLSQEDFDEIISGLAARYRGADGILMRGINMLGGAVETGLSRLPAAAQAPLETAVRAGLMQAHRGAALTERDRDGPRSEQAWLHKSLATLSGAAAGFFGPAGIAEVPITITLILRSIRSVARDYGYDPDDPTVAQDCLSVFAAGGPLTDDDGVDSAFLAARLTLSGPTLNRLLQRISARLAQTLGQKLGAQTVPVLGAIGGGAVNYAFMDYYTAMAHVKFGLKRLADDRDPTEVTTAFRRAVERPAPRVR